MTAQHHHGPQVRQTSCSSSSSLHGVCSALLSRTLPGVSSPSSVAAFALRFCCGVSCNSCNSLFLGFFFTELAAQTWVDTCADMRHARRGRSRGANKRGQACRCCRRLRSGEYYESGGMVHGACAQGGSIRCMRLACCRPWHAEHGTQRGGSGRSKKTL